MLRSGNDSISMPNGRETERFLARLHTLKCFPSPDSSSHYWYTSLFAHALQYGRHDWKAVRRLT